MRAATESPIFANDSRLIHDLTKSTCMIRAMHFAYRRYFVNWACAIVLSYACFSSGEENTNKLPELGDASSALVSPDAEKAIGEQFLKQIRAQLPTIDDPILKYYTNLNLYRLATHSDLKEVVLHPVLIDSDQINAFAAPGGIIGINLGLYLAAQDVHEYSSVIAHEIAHLSQRHFARGLEAQRAQSIPALLGMLTGALIVAAGGGEAGLATVTAAQALAQGEALRYSRGREKEADRVGLSTLARSKMDPYGMSRMFERMQRAYRFTERPPEFLLTHPITQTRIADALNQAAKYPRQEYDSSLEYLYMRARAVVHYAKTAQQAIRDARSRVETADSLDNRYLLALALSRAEKHESAINQMRALYENNENSILLTTSFAEILISANRLNEANQVLEKSLRLNPTNAPLSMLLARSLQEEERFSEAQKILWQQTRLRPIDTDTWYQLAEISGLAGNVIDVHRARAEYFVLHGAYQNAVQHLQYARSLVDENNSYLVLKLDQRIVDLRAEEEANRRAG